MNDYTLHNLSALPSSSILSAFFCEKVDLRVLQLGQRYITKKLEKRELSK